MSRAKAYAVVKDGEIQVNAVHARARGAMVNYLYLNGFSHYVHNGLPDEEIRKCFLYAKENTPGLDLVEIELRLISEICPETVDLLAPAPQHRAYLT